MTHAYPMNTAEDTKPPMKKVASDVADFIMFTQRSFLLDLSRELNRGNVSYAQFFLLGYLSSEQQLTMTDISRKMGHSTAAATGLVDRLEKVGYVQRLHAADDRRKVMVQITTKGIQLVQQLRDNLASNVADVMASSNNPAAPEIDKAAAFLKR